MQIAQKIPWHLQRQVRMLCQLAVPLTPLKYGLQHVKGGNLEQVTSTVSFTRWNSNDAIEQAYFHSPEYSNCFQKWGAKRGVLSLELAVACQVLLVAEGEVGWRKMSGSKITPEWPLSCKISMHQALSCFYFFIKAKPKTVCDHLSKFLKSLWSLMQE